jgi:hypothetical protein
MTLKRCSRKSSVNECDGSSLIRLCLLHLDNKQIKLVDREHDST